MGPRFQSMREGDCRCRQQALEGTGLLSVRGAQTSLRI